MQDPDITLYQLNYYKPLIDRAIKLTEQYVSDHKLILTGGMAIDLALRSKGQSIYEDDALPDYDIISDENLIHATALAEILCKEGLPDVNVINAVHITTVRVRMKNIVLLDSTYIPPVCFKKIPYLDVGHLRVVHPYYQLIDQRLSLSHLMADTGISLNIFNRLTKDVKRNLLLREVYPIDQLPKDLKMHTIKVPLSLIRVDESKINKIDSRVFIYSGNVCIAGYLGFLIMMSLTNSSKYNFEIIDDNLIISIPNQIPIRLLSCDIKSLNIDNPKTYRPLLNLKPISQCSGNYEYVDTYGCRISCNIINLNKEIKVCVASVDYLLMEMLRDRIYVNYEPFTTWYVELVNIVDEQRNIEKSSLMWWPSLNCYGVEDFPEYQIFMLERLMDPEKAKILKPKTSYPYPPKCATRSEFEQTNSHYFLIDGQQDSSINYTNYGHILESFQEYVTKKRIEAISN